MLTTNALFFIRLKQHWLRYYKTFLSICDWTVWLYILIPGAVIMSGLYIEWWKEAPEWSLNIPWPIILFVALLIITISSRITVFIDEADQLLLLQRPVWLHALKSKALIYSTFMLIMKIVLVLIILLPFIHHYDQWQLTTPLYIALLGLCSAIIFSIVKFLWKETQKWWTQLIQLIVFLIIVLVLIGIPFLSIQYYDWSPIYIGLILIVLLSVSIIAFMRIPISFHKQLLIENESKEMFTKTILSQSMELPTVSKRKKPLLFKQSQRFLQGNDIQSIVTDLYYKALLRDFGLLRPWIIFLGISGVALMRVTEYAFAPLALIAFLVILGASLFQLQWDQWSKQDFISSYISSVEQQLALKKKARNRILAVCIVIWIVESIIFTLL